MNTVERRLTAERNRWRKDQPVGFEANPTRNEDGSVNLCRWECQAPGPKNSIWAKGKFKFIIKFDPNKLNAPPRLWFTPPIFHPNVGSSGCICSDLRYLWPKITMKHLMYAVQTFLEKPNLDSALNVQAAKLYLEEPEKYEARVRSEIESV